jgi:hypothetical protein
MSWLKKYSTQGYKADSPDRFNSFNIIPSGNITMNEVDHPLLGIDNYGNKKLMLPGGEYTFPGSVVMEFPLQNLPKQVTVDYTGIAKYSPAEHSNFSMPLFEEGGYVEEMKNGGIPQRYKNMGFTHVGQKKQGDGQHKWKVLAKKGDSYKVVQGGYRGMQDFKQHHSEQRRKNFWSRMGGRDSAKATDPFSPLYWHKKFGTWEYGGPVEMEHGGMIKRADGSYSQRGLWDNIRANAGSGKEPTKEMLQQEKKIRAAEKKEYGGWLGQYQDGGKAGRKPIYTSDKSKVRAYQDSLNLYNAYDYQRRNTIKNPDDIEYLKSRGLYETWKKNIGNRDKKNDNNAFSHIELDKTYDPIDPVINDNKIINYYKSLPINSDYRIGKHSSPDLWHRTIKPMESYYDGVAWSPVYKKPVQPYIYGEQIQQLPYTLQELPTGTQYTPRDIPNPYITESTDWYSPDVQGGQYTPAGFRTKTSMNIPQYKEGGGIGYTKGANKPATRTTTQMPQPIPQYSIGEQWAMEHPQQYIGPAQGYSTPQQQRDHEYLRSKMYQQEAEERANREFAQKMAPGSELAEKFMNAEMLMSGAGMAGKALKPLAKNAYKINPWANKLNNPNAYYRAVDENAYLDAIQNRVIRSNPEGASVGIFLNGKEVRRPTAFPSFAKGKVHKDYLPKEGNGYIYESQHPMVGPGEINPVTGKVVKRGRHFAHRPINEQGQVINEIPIEAVNVYKGQPHWLKGYQQVDVPGGSGGGFPMGIIGNTPGNTPMPTITEVPQLNKEQQILQSFGVNPRTGYQSTPEMGAAINFGYKPPVTNKEKVKMLFMNKDSRHKFLTDRTVDDAFQFADRALSSPEYKKRYAAMKSMTPSIEADKLDIAKKIRSDVEKGIVPADWSQKEILAMDDNQLMNTFQDIYQYNVSDVPHWQSNKFKPFVNRINPVPERTSVQHLRKDASIDYNADSKRGMYYGPNMETGTGESISVGAPNYGDLYNVTVHEAMGHGKTYAAGSFTEKERQLLSSVFKDNNNASNYIKTPTEVMARIDEMRSVLNPKNPYAKVSETDIDKLQSMLGTNKFMNGEDPTMLQLIKNVDKKKLVEVMNKMYTPVGIAAGAASLNENKYGGSIQQYQNGGHDYLRGTKVDDYNMSDLLKSLNKIGIGATVTAIAKSQKESKKYGGWLSKYK